MKGIILAGGAGTRLYPLTISVSKQLLPVYDKPTIYYPLSILMLSGIRDILIISTPEDTPRIEGLIGDGSQLGLTVFYKVQEHPRGLADAFILGADFIGTDSVCMILGDNVFYGHGLPDMLRRAASRQRGATVFGYYVEYPQRYGIVEFDENRKVMSIEEKPQNPKSNYAVTGLYFYDNRVVDIAAKVRPSERGELEITDVNRAYMERGELHLELMGRGFAWLDTGTHGSRMDASNFVKIIEERQSLKIACVEEIAFRMNYITRQQLASLAEALAQTGYGEYLMKVVNGDFN